LYATVAAAVACSKNLIDKRTPPWPLQTIAGVSLRGVLTCTYTVLQL
jgi:hypothetical protein